MRPGLTIYKETYNYNNICLLGQGVIICKNVQLSNSLFVKATIDYNCLGDGIHNSKTGEEKI